MLYYLRRSTPFIVLYTLGVALLGYTIGATPEVNIPDANLRAVIEKALDKPDGAAITAADMATLTDLSATGAKIRDLIGLEFAVNLTVLFLNDNQFSDLSPVAGLTNLEALSLDENRIEDLSPLKELTNLKQLHLYKNRVTDVSPLAGLTKLQTLGLVDNRVSDVSPLVELTGLKELDLRSNSLNPRTVTTDIPRLEAKGVYVEHSSR